MSRSQGVVNPGAIRRQVFDTMQVKSASIGSDEVNKYQRRFRELLDERVVLLNMLASPSLGRLTRLPIEANCSAESAQWHRFLDHLSWLGDYKAGGQTVTSIAAEKHTLGTTFWVANNCLQTAMVVKHLKWVLAKLQQLIDEPTSVTVIQQDIAVRSISFSYRRVASYKRHFYVFAQRRKSLQKSGPGSNPGCGVASR